MASIVISGISEWDNEYARLARMGSQMRTTGFSISASSSSPHELQQGLHRLEQSLNGLPLQPGEIQRRRRLVQHLQQTTMAGGGATTAPTTSLSSNHHPGGVAPQQQQQSSSSSSSQMAMAMRQQDDMIDQLAAGVGRLKNQTIAVNEEARLHVNLLNEMDTQLDAAHVGLEDETRRAARLKEDSSVWKLQMTVAGLSVLLVLLILMGLSP